MGQRQQLNIDTSMFSLEHANPTRNPDGSYNVIVGAFNIWSGNGTFYVMTDVVRGVFAPGSVLQNRVAAGDVFIEDGHPPYIPGMSIPAYLDDLMTKHDHKVCGKITYLSLDDTPTIVAGQREGVYIVRAKVIPFGPLGPKFAQSLNDPNSNTALSVRGLNNSERLGGILHKEIHTIMTYDFVKIPGIRIAKKSEWGNYSTEDLHIEKFDLDEILFRLSEREKTATESENAMIEQVRSAIAGCSDGCIYKEW